MLHARNEMIRSPVGPSLPAAAIVRLGRAGVNGLAHLEGGSGEAGASSERQGYFVCTQFEPLLLRRRSYLLEQRR